MSSTGLSGGNTKVSVLLKKTDNVALAGFAAKALITTYIIVMLAIISFLTLPISLLISFPLIMFFVNTCLIFSILSMNTVLSNNLGGLIGGSLVIAISSQSILFVLFTNSGIRWLSFLIIPIFYLVFALLKQPRSSTSTLSIKYIDAIVLALVTVLTIVFTVLFRLAHPIANVREFLNLPADVPLFGTMVRAISATGLSETGFASGFPIKYHWLSYGYLSSLDEATPMDLLPLIAHFTPVLFLFTSLLLISSISAVNWMPSISQVLGIAGALCLGYVGVSRNIEFSNLPWFSPSTLLGGTLVLVLSIVVLRSITLGLTLEGILLLVLLTSFIFLAKISAGIVFLAALSLFTVYSLAFLRNMFRTLGICLVISATMGITCYVIFFAGTGNEIALDSIFDFNSLLSLQSIVNLGVPFAALLAIAIPWAGILIGHRGGQALPLEQVWALSLGIPALLFYALTTAPDQNDKFFVIAAGIYIFPISFLIVISFLQESLQSSAFRIRIVIYLAPTIAFSIALFFISDRVFFDVRPTLFPTITLVFALILGIIFTVLLMGPKERRLKTIINASMSTLVIISIFFSLSQFVLTRIGALAENEVPYIPLMAQDRIETYLPATVEKAADLELSTGEFISFVVQGPDSNTIERWVRFSSGHPSFTSGETDVRRLTSAPAGEVLLSRNDKILNYLNSKSSEVRDELCLDGLRAIWVYPYDSFLNENTLSHFSSSSDFEIVDLGCL